MKHLVKLAASSMFLCVSITGTEGLEWEHKVVADINTAKNDLEKADAQGKIRSHDYQFYFERNLRKFMIHHWILREGGGWSDAVEITGPDANGYQFKIGIYRGRYDDAMVRRFVPKLKKEDSVSEPYFQFLTSLIEPKDKKVHAVINIYFGPKADMDKLNEIYLILVEATKKALAREDPPAKSSDPETKPASEEAKK